MKSKMNKGKWAMLLANGSLYAKFITGRNFQVPLVSVVSYEFVRLLFG